MPLWGSIQPRRILQSATDMVFQRRQPLIRPGSPKPPKPIINVLLLHALYASMANFPSRWDSWYRTVFFYVGVFTEPQFLRGPMGVNAFVDGGTEVGLEMRELLISALTDLILILVVVGSVPVGEPPACPYGNRYKRMVADIRRSVDTLRDNGDIGKANRAEKDLAIIENRPIPKLLSSGYRSKMDEGWSMTVEAIQKIESACKTRMRHARFAECDEEVDRKISATQKLLDEVIQLTTKLNQYRLVHDSPGLDFSRCRAWTREAVEKLKVYKVTRAETLSDEEREVADAVLRRFLDKYAPKARGEASWTEAHWDQYAEWVEYRLQKPLP